MLGTTGVGKTASVQALAEILYGSAEAMLQLDMSEYVDKWAYTKLIGVSQGYVGQEKGGRLTNWLKKRPASIVLLDEVEKAAPEVFDLLLQVFDAGRITDGNNETIKCTDTIFIMTSNLGAKEIQNFWESKMLAKTPQGEEKVRQPLEGWYSRYVYIGKKIQGIWATYMQKKQIEPAKHYTEAHLQLVVEQELSKFFRPEFIGRIQEIVTFLPLTPEEIGQVAELQCRTLKKLVESNINCPGLSLEWDQSLINLLVKHGYNPEKGARQLAHCITKYVTTPITEMMLGDKITANKTIYVSADEQRVLFKIKKMDE